MIDGIIPLWKEAGVTSHDCVARARRLLKTKKVGHSGTLDPSVTGVLPLCIGKATKAVDYLHEAPKAYEGVITLGRATTTEDANGETVEALAVETAPAKQRIEEALQALSGSVTQVPPMFSAVKVRGRKLYEYAREGIEVERPVREACIYDFRLLEMDDAPRGGEFSFKIRVSCSKGTYVRTLAVDAGKKLGYPAHLQQLIRTASGGFEPEHTSTWEELEALVAAGRPEKAVYPVDWAVAHLPAITVSEETAEQISHGRVLPAAWFSEQTMAVKAESGKPLAVYTAHPAKPGIFKPKTMLL
ncbi:tRNA pseudouridine(55) synthase TruB [Marinococcus halophilus]|uniref:tRNA pseudouridine(55) synthase TruB n=1 Tax=Marinococcus halophilus TaxID=1371 RepID=UPI003144E78A